jgi:hypothetical protein
MRSEFASLRAANQIEVLQQVSPLKERLSVLEIKPGRKPPALRAGTKK